MLLEATALLAILAVINAAETPADVAAVPASDAAAETIRRDLVRSIWGPTGIPSRSAPAAVLDSEAERPAAGPAAETVLVWWVNVTLSDGRVLRYRQLVHHERHNASVDAGPCVAIAGHGNGVGGGDADMANEAFERGECADVFTAEMWGYSRDEDFRVCDAARGCDLGRNQVHAQLYSLLPAPADEMPALRLFLEPVILTLNYANASSVRPARLFGTSGGGWQATLTQALDQRVALAVATAGHMPWSIRRFRKVREDWEQSRRQGMATANPCWYWSTDADNGGALWVSGWHNTDWYLSRCPWECLYALAASEGRVSVHLLGEDDEIVPARGRHAALVAVNRSTPPTFRIAVIDTAAHGFNGGGESDFSRAGRAAAAGLDVGPWDILGSRAADRSGEQCLVLDYHWYVIGAAAAVLAIVGAAVAACWCSRCCCFRPASGCCCARNNVAPIQAKPVASTTGATASASAAHAV